MIWTLCTRPNPYAARWSEYLCRLVGDRLVAHDEDDRVILDMPFAEAVLALRLPALGFECVRLRIDPVLAGRLL